MTNEQAESFRFTIFITGLCCGIEAVRILCYLMSASIVAIRSIEKLFYANYLLLTLCIYLIQVIR